MKSNEATLARAQGLEQDDSIGVPLVRDSQLHRIAGVSGRLRKFAMLRLA